MEPLVREVCSMLADALEVSSVSPDDDYRTLPLWGSLSAFMLKVVISRKYMREMSLKQLGSYSSARDLAQALAV